MKKGCFVKSIVILTIFVAVLAYIVQYKFDEWIIEPGKKLLLPAVEKGFKDELAFVKHSTEKDTLLNLISSYIKSIDFKSADDSSKSDFWNKINEIVNDSMVTKKEVEDLNNLFRSENEK
jgi:hypothetical protein